MTAPHVEAQVERRPGIGIRLLGGYLDRVLNRKAAVRIVEPHGASVDIGEGPPRFEFRMHDDKLLWEFLLSPSLALGEAYMDRRISIAGGDLYEFLDYLLASHRDRARIGPSWREWLRRHARFLLQLNTRVRARQNVHCHYDDKAQLWDMFLDAYRQYTCGYFPLGAVHTIDEAQLLKMDHIARKLLLRPGLKVLDIGAGWGGLGVHLAKNYGVTVEGITLSQDQLEYARDYAEQNGVGDRVSFRIQDYRTLSESYDRIVAVGMLEHVGVDYYPVYFKTIRKNLNPKGVALIHVIGRPSPPGANEPFMNKYIFPGTHVPALSEVVAPIERSGLFLTDVEMWRMHYADTLRAWREKFYGNWRIGKELYGERFCLMWEYYLAGCEVAFRRGVLQVFQFQLARNFDTVPVTRDYLYRPEG